VIADDACNGSSQIQGPRQSIPHVQHDLCTQLGVAGGYQETILRLCGRRLSYVMEQRREYNNFAALATNATLPIAQLRRDIGREE
jgi:hypothetical protein